MVGVDSLSVGIVVGAVAVAGDQRVGSARVIDANHPIAILKVGIHRGDRDDKVIGKADLGKITQKIRRLRGLQRVNEEELLLQKIIVI